MIKVQSGLLVVLLMAGLNCQPVLADQTTSNVGIMFTGQWFQPGAHVVPPTGNDHGDQQAGGQIPGDGNHLVVVSKHAAHTTTKVAKLPQTGSQRVPLQVGLFGIGLLISGAGLRCWQKRRFRNDV